MQIRKRVATSTTAALDDEVDADDSAGSEFTGTPVPRSTKQCRVLGSFSLNSSGSISLASEAVKRIQRAVRSKLCLAYSRVYATDFLSPGVGVPIAYISAMRCLMMFLCCFVSRSTWQSRLKLTIIVMIVCTVTITWYLFWELPLYWVSRSGL